jgi:hypothetical protein
VQQSYAWIDHYMRIKNRIIIIIIIKLFNQIMTLFSYTYTNEEPSCPKPLFALQSKLSKLVHLHSFQSNPLYIYKQTRNNNILSNTWLPIKYSSHKQCTFNKQTYRHTDIHTHTHQSLLADIFIYRLSTPVLLRKIYYSTFFLLHGKIA